MQEKGPRRSPFSNHFQPLDLAVVATWEPDVPAVVLQRELKLGKCRAVVLEVSRNRNAHRPCVDVADGHDDLAVHPVVEFQCNVLVTKQDCRRVAVVLLLTETELDSILTISNTVATRIRVALAVGVQDTRVKAALVPCKDGLVCPGILEKKSSQVDLASQSVLMSRIPLFEAHVLDGFGLRLDLRNPRATHNVDGEVLLALEVLAKAVAIGRFDASRLEDILVNDEAPTGGTYRIGELVYVAGPKDLVNIRSSFSYHSSPPL